MTCGDGDPGGLVEGSDAGVTRQERPLGAGATRMEGLPGVPALGSTPREQTTQEPAAPYLVLPAKVSARYEWVRELPSIGAQADVVLVRERDSGVERAIKLHRGQVDIDWDVLETVRRQGAAEHVVGSVCDADGRRTWEVMEFFPLGHLDDYVRRQGGSPLRPELVRAILVELSAALAHLHDLKIVHRDLKPANVLVRSDDPLDLVLTDFGVARTKVGSDMFTGIAGSLAYMPPEAFSGHVSEAADWWGLGVILWELLAGRPLFSDDEGNPLSQPVILKQLIQRRWHVEPISDPRWQLLLKGLLTAEAELRWRAAEVRTWLAGGSPEAAWLGTASEAAPDQVTGTFFFAGQAYTDPANLAAALAADWDGACNFVQCYRAASLANWLSTTSFGTGVEELLFDIRRGQVPPSGL